MVRYGKDAARYFLLKTASFEKDVDFSWREFKEGYNNELIGIFEKEEFLDEIRKKIKNVEVFLKIKT